MGWRPVPGSVIRLLDVTRIALASTALAVGSGDSIRSAVTAIINTTAVMATRVVWHIRWAWPLSSRTSMASAVLVICNGSPASPPAMSVVMASKCQQ